MRNATLTKDRICTVLHEILYSMADNENQAVYEPLELKWVLPVDSPKGMISVIKNMVIVMGYVQKHNCNKACIDKIIENDIRPMVSSLKDEIDFTITYVLIAIFSTIEDYSNTGILMDIVWGVLGKFIEGLELVYNDSVQSENNYANVDVHTIDTSGLVIGMTLKNYKLLCEILGEEVKTGEAKKYQLKKALQV